jgi:hypothetical protein
VLLAVVACKGSGDRRRPPTPASDARARLTPLEQAREKYLMLDAALEKLRGEIAEAEAAGDQAKLAELKDKEIAVTLALAQSRKEMESLEAEQGTQPGQ